MQSFISLHMIVPDLPTSQLSSSSLHPSSLFFPPSLPPSLFLPSADKSEDLTFAGKGKHFIGDFLPPDELEKFQEKVRALKEGRDPDFSDYSQHKLTEENIGFQMLQQAGWTEGSGLGSKGEGIQAPVNKWEHGTDTRTHTSMHTCASPHLSVTSPVQREAVLPAGGGGDGECGRGGQRR